MQPKTGHRNMTEYYDGLETRDPAKRQAALIKAVAEQVGQALKNAPAWGEILAGVSPEDLTSPQAIAALPLTRKSELAERQQALPPFGGLAACAEGELKYVFSSPGPIYEPATHRENYWRLARALFAAGFRPGDLAQNCFSYHLTPAGMMGDSGCHALGCAVIPAGIGNTELQVKTLEDLKPDGYIGTPSFLKIILEKADELGVEVPNLRKALVSGEAFPPSTRRYLTERGIHALQAYATADLGLIAYETIADHGLIIEEHVYLEIVRPGSGQPVADGEVGEVVVTVLNPDYPLIRFATGDLSAIKAGISECGRTNRRIRGWMGRADQTAKVRGMFVHPSQIHEVLGRHDEIIRARLVIDWVDERDHLTLKCETRSTESGLPAAIADSIRELCKVRGEVQLVAPGSLPNDGVVIEDARKYS